jgi:transcriptional regulator with XRE-family HTH domain
MPGRFRRVDEIPQGQAAVVGANIRVLRQQHGWNQARVGELMGWSSNSTVCAAEGRRNGRQRGFTTQGLSGWPQSSTSPHHSSRRGARTAAGTRRQGSPA